MMPRAPGGVSTRSVLQPSVRQNDDEKHLAQRSFYRRRARTERALSEILALPLLRPVRGKKEGRHKVSSNFSRLLVARMPSREGDQERSEVTHGWSEVKFRDCLQSSQKVSATSKVPAHLAVLQGMHKATYPHYRPRLNILGCFVLLHALRKAKPYKLQSRRD